MRTLWTAFNYLGIFIGIAFSLLALSRRKRSPAVTLAWLLSFFLLPYVGPFFYSLVGYSKYQRRRRLKPSPQKKLIETLVSAENFRSAATVVPPEFIPTSFLAEKLTGFPAIGGNRLAVYRGEEEIYKELTARLENAKHHIHMEYYIFQAEGIGQHFVDLLVRKAKEGVTCRLLVDHVGSFWLSRKFVKDLRAEGVQFAFFSPLAWRRPWGFHLRNHRKLMIIDGHLGFVGSQNICSDYKRWQKRKIEWIDSQLFVDGPGTRQLQSIFLEDWAYTTGESVTDPAYFPDTPPLGDSYMQALPTGPDEHDRAFEKILMTMIHSAESRVTMTTPYFVPTAAVALSLEAAVLRGVKVDLLVPRYSDQWWVDAASRSWFYDLLRGGVNIYLCTDKFLHAKEVTIDRKMTLIGSANMDERSFRLNFECSALMYDVAQTENLLSSFDKLAAESQKQNLESFDNQAFLPRLRDGLFRLLSPLL